MVQKARFCDWVSLGAGSKTAGRTRSASFQSKDASEQLFAATSQQRTGPVEVTMRKGKS
jgi:hypothetical protein